MIVSCWIDFLPTPPQPGKGFPELPKVARPHGLTETKVLRPAILVHVDGHEVPS